jgi:UDP-N-acetylmuramate dehydrogenase
MSIKSAKIRENVPLADYTTMKVGGLARYFVEVENKEELKQFLGWAEEENLPIFILAGGSNLIISDQGFEGLVARVNIKGFEVVKENEQNIVLKIGAGENWDKVVARAVENNWWGIENMSLIHGMMGGIVVQNAGAYGQEIEGVVEKVLVYDQELKQEKELLKKELAFGYRESIFKKEKKYVILEVFLFLKKKGEPRIDYPDVVKYFQERKIEKPSLEQIREAIIFIRQNKLPDPEKIASAGSFFKNLILNSEEYEILKEKVGNNFGGEALIKLEEMKNKFASNKGIKIPTGWIIDLCGLKGKQMGKVRIYEKQGLVVINEGGMAKEVMELFKRVRQEVYQKTGMKLEMEPEMVGFKREEVEGYFKLEE